MSDPNDWTSTPPEREGWYAVYHATDREWRVVHSRDLIENAGRWSGFGWLWHTEPLAMPEPPEVGDE